MLKYNCLIEPGLPVLSVYMDVKISHQTKSHILFILEFTVTCVVGIILANCDESTVFPEGGQDAVQPFVWLPYLFTYGLFPFS